jgi:hypothetical protein
MRHMRSFIYLILAILALLAACAPNTAGATPTGGIVPITGDTAVPSEVVSQHQLVPGELPAERSSHAGDQDSSATAAQQRAPGGDRFTFGQYERPFNADTMDTYFPYLDIQDTTIYQDDTWVYAVIDLKDGDSNGGLPGKYAVEVDLNKDGRGDWLVIVTHPASTDWKSDGVQVFTDKNGDVGGSVIVNSDKQVSSGDGYETLVFDQAHGGDPDAAFARIAPDNPHEVQIAAKRSLFGTVSAYLAGAWAGADDLSPASFDLNDHLTHDQAGEAEQELEYYYPIKQLSEVDNTCRMAVGFEPTGLEPRVCNVAVPGSCKPPAGGCNTQNGYHWDAKQCCCAYYDVGCGF